MFSRALGLNSDSPQISQCAFLLRNSCSPQEQDQFFSLRTESKFFNLYTSFISSTFQFRSVRRNHNSLIDL